MAKAKKPTKQIKITFDKKGLASYIVAVRENRDLSVSQVSKETKLGRATIHALESGRLAPNVVTYAKIISFLGTSADEFFIKK